MAEAVSTAVAAMTKKLHEGDVKPSIGDFVKLLDLQQAMLNDNISEIKITWVEDLDGTEYSTEI